MADNQNWWDSAPPVAEDAGPVLGPPPKPVTPSIPSGYEPDPAKPGALRPTPGGPSDPNANDDDLDPGTVTFYAQQVLSGAPLPPMGMGKQAAKMRQEIMKAVAKQAGASGLSGSDLARQITHYKAQSGNIQNLEKQLGTVTQNEQTALANGQQFLDRSQELPGQTQYPLLNSVTQTIQRNIPVPGHDTVSAMDAAYNTFVNEYAKVVSGSPSGSGVLSDSARHEAMDMLRSNASLSQKQRALAQMKADMANRIAASHKVIEDSYQNLTQKPGYQVPSDLGLAALPGAPPIGGSGGGGSGDGGGGGPSPLKELTPEQKDAFSAFIAKSGGKPSGEQVRTYLKGLLNVSDVPNADKIAAAIAQGSGFSGSVEDVSRDQQIRQRIEDENKAGLGTDSLTTDLVHSATLGLSDEAAGVGEAAANVLTSPFTGKFHPIESYRFGRDVERQRIEDAQSALGGAAAPVEFVGGMASAAPTSALAAVRSVPELVRQGARGGAAAGALAGFGQGEGLEQSTSGAVVGAGGGAAVGALAPYAVNKVTARFAPQGLAPDLARASEAEGVDLLRPMVDPASRGKFGSLESSPGSQNVIREGVDRVRGQIEDRVAALGGGGTALETDAAGERVQNAARQFIQRSRGVANRLYNRARSLAGDTRFVPQNALDAVESQVAQLRSNPQTNAGEINFLEGLHSDLATPGGKTIEELRQLRASLRGRISEQNLTHTQAESRAIGVLDAAQQDAAANLPRGAADAYRRADTFYRERMVHVDDILDRFLGGNVQAGQARLSGEQAFQRLKNMASPGGDARRLAGLMRDLEPSERQDISATIASTLGRRAPDQPFSSDLFLSQTSKLSPSARRVLFGQDGAQSIENLRTLSQALKEGIGDVNRSRTANSVIRQMAKNFIGSITGLGTVGFAAGGTHGAATGAIAGAGIQAAGIGRNVLSARAMVNPRVSAWLAQAANVATPSQAQNAVRGLTLVISREPALAQELTPVRDFLDQRVTQLLAAEPDDQQNSQRP
jgi:hypothetical protein